MLNGKDLNQFREIFGPTLSTLVPRASQLLVYSIIISIETNQDSFQRFEDIKNFISRLDDSICHLERHLNNKEIKMIFLAINEAITSDEPDIFLAYLIFIKAVLKEKFDEQLSLAALEKLILLTSTGLDFLKIQLLKQIEHPEKDFVIKDEERDVVEGLVAIGLLESRESKPFSKCKKFGFTRLVLHLFKMIK